MKKAINLIIMYFVTLISGLIVGTVLYSFYINVLNFVAGTEIEFFTKKEILDAFYYVAFCLLFIICPLVSYYKIRHPGGVAQKIAFVILALITWCVALPGVYKLSENYAKKSDYETEPIRLSKGYFRQVDNKVYYFTKNFGQNNKGVMTTNAVIIDTSENGDVYIKNIADDSNLDVYKCAEPYKEILVKNTFHKNDFPISINFRNIIKKCDYSLNKGILTFIGFLSLGFVLASVFALTNVFKWKLLNTMLLTSLSCIILLFNSNPLILPFYGIESRFYSSGFIQFLSKFGQEPLLIFSNYVLGLVFIITGVVIFIVRRHRNKKRNR